MSNSRPTEKEQRSLREFCDFVESAPVEPPPTADARIMWRVKTDLQPPIGWLYAKFATIEAAAGVATLSVCPQFGGAFGWDYGVFDGISEQGGFFSVFLVCGLLFVVTGAALSALLLGVNELKAITTGKYIYYLGFAVAAFLSFYAVGAQIIWLSAAPWILGAYLGNLLGFGVVSRLRVA